MKSDNILKADLLDIVFDNRNKNYGAYELRKHYKRRLLKAIAGTFIISGGIACISFFVKDKKGNSILDKIDDTFLVSILDEVKPLEPKKPELPKPVVKAAAPKPIAQQQHTANIAITKNEAEVSKINTLTDQVAIGNKTVEGEPYKGEIIVDNPIKITSGGHVVPEQAKVDVVTPRATAEVMPAFPGGMSALHKFLQKNLQSPEDLEEGTIISVKVRFVVGYDGKLKSFEIVEDGGATFNKEVIRVLKKMPEWVPGKANGENVSVYYTIPVKFTAAN
ncbi:MAG TPA: energy transducer TonB [Ferruginibacter sp.]|nr:energy transducer TonB [Ferruginibacter sp.]HRE63071.1 energy transducer TonB [Ferruginibacter sp.]